MYNVHIYCGRLELCVQLFVLTKFQLLHVKPSKQYATVVNKLTNCKGLVRKILRFKYKQQSHSFKGTGSRDRIQAWTKIIIVLGLNKNYYCFFYQFSKCPSDGRLSLHMGEVTYIGETSTKFLCGPRRFLSFHWLSSRFLLVHCSSPNIFFFKISKRLFKKIKICLRPSNMFYLFIEIYGNCFQLNHGEMANSITHRRTL